MENAENNVANVKSHHIGQNICELPHAQAAFDSQSREGVPTCSKHTRTKVLKEILTWFGSGEHLIRVVKGVRKTTIAQTITMQVDKQGRLFASFYFSLYDADRNTSRRFFTTIARQMAYQSEGFAVELSKVLEQSHDIAEKTATLQFQKLVPEPLR